MSIEKWKDYALLMRLHKPIGILLLLWPTLWALWLAGEGKPNVTIFIVFIVGVLLTRSAGCIVNDYADRRFDGAVKRTSMRPLATGKLRAREVLFVFLNTYAIYLAMIGAGMTVIYPFLKRVTNLPQLGLGFAFSWGVPMAFAAQANHIPPQAWFLYLTAILWPLIYDTMYAMTDREDDIKIGIKSTAILFGNHDVVILALLQALFLLCLFWVGQLFHLKWPYAASLVLIVVFFLYQQYLMKDRDPQFCFNAFLNNNWVGLILFIGIVGSEWG